MQSEIETITVDGSLIYDPRVKKRIVSDNPALVLADMAHRRFIITPWEFNDEFWAKIGKLADFCDYGMAVEEKYGRRHDDMDEAERYEYLNYSGGQ